jgi:hypothetical protein
MTTRAPDTSTSEPTDQDDWVALALAGYLFSYG